MRKLLLTLLILNGLLLPVSAVALLLLFHSVNPMALAFITGFTVENRTSERLRVTPVGTIGTEGHRSTLPTCLFRFPAVPAFRNGGFEIAPGGSVRLYYDGDDINFSEIVVYDSKGTAFVVVVDPEPEKNPYHAPRQDRFVIENVSTLAVPSPRVLEAAGKAGPRRGLWGVIVLGFVALFSFLRLRRAYRRAVVVPNPPARQGV